MLNLIRGGVWNHHHELNKKRIIAVLISAFVLLPINLISPYIIDKNKAYLKDLEAEYKALVINSFLLKESDYRKHDGNIYVKYDILNEVLGEEFEQPQPLVRFHDADYVLIDQVVNEEINHVYRELDEKVYLVPKEKLIELQYDLKYPRYEKRVVLIKLVHAMAINVSLWVFCSCVIPLWIYFVFPIFYYEHRDNILLSFYENE